MGTTPIRTYDFIKSHGVNTHINYNDGKYADLSLVIGSLAYLGIDRVRDALNYPGQFGGPSIGAYEAVAKAGVKFSLIVGVGGALITRGGVPSNPSLDQRVGHIEQLARSVPGSVIAVEGPNEINNQPLSYNGAGLSLGGQDELNAALAMQRDLYAMVKASPALNGVPVYNFTGDASGSVPAGPSPATAPGLADYDTQHPYPNHGQAPGYWVSRAKALSQRSAQGGPLVYTETGYSSNGGIAGAVNADVQAKYTLDLLLDAAREGVSAVYLYELLDAYRPGAPQGNSGYGLFGYDGAPKPVAVALRAMNTILADTGAGAATFTPTMLPYAVSSQSLTGATLAMAKSDGSHVIALWDEQPIWDASRGVQLAPITYQYTVKLGDGAQRYTVIEHDPLAGTDPVATFDGVGQVTVAVSDHLVFLTVKPAPAPAPAPIPSAPVPPPGRTEAPAPAPGGLVLTMTEDAWRDDAQFTVSIDGRQSGGIRTVTALRAAGQSQAFAVEGALAAGPHEVTIAFINDAWGGTPDTDRNLFLTGATYDGQDIAGSVATLLSGAASFGLTVPSLPTPGFPTPGVLALTMAEDEWRGDAQFTVSIDGQQAGGIRTVTAQRAAGQSQAFAVGPLGAGPHQVGITFINDAWGGTPGTDRNLILLGATYGGQDIAGSAASLFSNGTASFGLIVSPAS